MSCPSRRPRSLFEIPTQLSSLKINSLSTSDLAGWLQESHSHSPCPEFVIFDCRKYDRYAQGHIENSESLEKWTTLLHTTTEIVKHFTSNGQHKKFVLYDEHSQALKECGVFILPFVEELLTKTQEVYLLRGGYTAFSYEYHQLCTFEDVHCRRLSTSTAADLHDSNSLPIQSPSLQSSFPLMSSRGSACLLKSCLAPEKATASYITRAASMVVLSPDTNHASPDSFCTFLPSAILPYIFIGSEFDAKDLDFLTQRNISHVLNCSTHVPCFYENRGLIKYKRLPVCDTDSDNIKQYFDEASQFIESAQQSGGHVLVHCQAGISRSPSFVLAYLISRKHMAFSEAYSMLSRLRPIIAPNFNFLAQLHEFETELLTNGADSRRSSSEITTISSLASSSDYEGGTMGSDSGSEESDDKCNNSTGRVGSGSASKPLPLLLAPAKRSRMMSGANLSGESKASSLATPTAEDCFL